MARCSSVRFPVSVCDGQAAAVSVRGFPSHPPEVNGSATEHTAFKVFHPVGRAAQAAVCKTAEAGAIPAQDSKPSPSASRRAKAARRSFSEGGLTSILRGFGWQAILSGIGVERHTPVFQTGIEGALPSCPSISQVNLACRQRPRTVEVMAGRRVRCAWDFFYATRIPVPVRTSQTWLRRFNSAFVSRSGCKHCSDAAVS